MSQSSSSSSSSTTTTTATSSFQLLFNAALQDYAKQTGTKLEDHPIAQQLKNCDSIDSISSVLQEHARRFQEFRGKDGKIMKSLKRAVHVLYMLSNSTALGEGIGIVSPKSVVAIFCPSCASNSHSHRPKPYLLPSLSCSL
jgi:hypothetical protein